MTAPAEHRRPRLSSLAVLAPVATLAVYVGVAVAYGMSEWAFVRTAVMTLLLQLLPGALLWRVLRPRHGWLVEDLAMGMAMGIVIAVPAQILAGLAHSPWPAVALPLLVVALVLGFRQSRQRSLGAQWAPVPWWWHVTVAVAAFASLARLLDFVRTTRLTWPAGPGAPHIDAYLHVALASELLERGPVSWPTVVGEPLGYHWFTHAWAAHVANISGADLSEILLRIAPATMPVIVGMCVGAVGLRLGGPFVGALAAALTFIGGSGSVIGGPPIGSPISPDSPTLALGAPPLLALVAVLALRWRGEAWHASTFLVPLVSLVACGTKGSTAPVLVAGLALAAVAMRVFNRRMVRQLVLDTGLVALGLAIAFVFVFRLSSAGLKPGITQAAQQTPLATVLGEVHSTAYILAACVLVATGALARAALLAVLPFTRRGRRDPLVWVLVGSCLAAAGSLAVFSHPGRSQYYFLGTAVPLAALGSALGAQTVIRWAGPRRARTLGLLAALTGAALYWVPALLVGSLTRTHPRRLWGMLAVAVVCAVAAVVVAVLLSRRLRRPAGAVALFVLAGAALVTGALSTVTRVSTTSAPAAYVPRSLTAPLATTDAQLAAARYIRQHSRYDDIVMTNRHCTTPRSPYVGCDSRRWIVTAVSQRQSYVEGWTATPRATQIAPEGRASITIAYWHPERLKLNDGFISAPTAGARDALWRAGVRWVYVDKTMPHADDLAPFAVRRLDNRDASVYQLVSP